MKSEEITVLLEQLSRADRLGLLLALKSPEASLLKFQPDLSDVQSRHSAEIRQEDF